MISSFVHRFLRLVSIARRRGLGYPLSVVKDGLLPRLAADFLLRVPLDRYLPAVVSNGESAEIVAPDESSFVSAEVWLPEATWRAARVQSAAVSGSDVKSVVLGRIDNDGRFLPLCLLPLCGEVPEFESVTTDGFMERYRYDLDLVVESGRVLVRKDYRDDRVGFRRERAALRRLGGIAGPALHRDEPDRLRLYKAFLPGPTLRQELVRAGARILSVDTETDPELAGLGASERIEAVWARGRACLPALPEGTIDALERQLDEVHRRGVTGFSLTFGNVVLVGPQAVPRFLDFDGAETHVRPRGLRFDLARDRDRRTFARIYGRDLVTERSAREILRRIATPYSPIDLGRGLVTRGFWSVDSGTGRWEFLNGPALRGRIEGRRILDLGSFNALMPLLMLAAGARQVVAVEQSPDMIPVAQNLRRLFEWRDLCRYDLDLRCADMRAILDGEWGRFDLVTAFCSLYYLEEDEMARVVRRAAELAPVMVLQAKTDTRTSAAHRKAAKSSLAFSRQLLEQNGFPAVEVIGPSGFTRPLLFGRQ